MAALGLCWVVALPAGAAGDADPLKQPAATQNAAFLKWSETIGPRFSCPKSVAEQIERRSGAPGANGASALAGYGMPSMTKWAMLRQFQAMPMLMSSPEAVGMAAQQAHMSEDEFRRFVATGGRERPQGPKFQSRMAARIVIDNRVPQYCDGRCEANLAWSTMLSVGLWRTMCFECSEDFLSVISIGPRHWVDKRILDWLAAPLPRSAATFPLSNQSMAVGSIGAVSRVSAPGTKAPATPARPGYELVDVPSPVQAAACDVALLREPTRPPALVAVQQALCRTEEVDTSLMTMRFVLTPQATSCGSAKAFVACARTDHSVELTFDDTRYTLPDVYGGQAISVGPAGAYEVNALSVLMHEVGHWFGLAHIDDPAFLPQQVPDLMQGVYQSEACLSYLSLSRVNTLTEPQYLQRLQRGAGLRRPPGVGGQ